MPLFSNFKKLFAKHHQNKLETIAVNNPYVSGAAGRREWNDRYMNMAKVIRNWQTACASMVVLTFIMILIIVKMATQSRIQPVVVETTRGLPIAILPVTDTLKDSAKLVNFAVNQFIINARTIIADTTAQKAMLDKVYAYSADSILSFLHDYYQQHNPFELAAQHTTHISIINSTPVSANTWQVTWDEIQKNTNVESSHQTTRWMANVTTRFGEVNANYLNDNPFGIYITHVSWSLLPTSTE